jgi:hypothetical protein
MLATEELQRRGREVSGENRSMTEKTLSRETDVNEREDWLAELERLVADAEGWSAEQDWLVERETKPISESRLGTYRAPALKIRRPDAVLLLEPFARDVMGALGCVDFSVFPSFERVMVVLTPKGWKFVAPNKKGLQAAWSKRNFLRMADDLAARR